MLPSHTLAAALLAALVSFPGFGQADRPNILVVLSDDQGWGDLSLHGNTNLWTPNVDSLAREGAQFENFYVSPVCSPTRAEFLSGRYHVRGGVYGTSAGSERLGLEEPVFVEALKEAGYATGGFGKWHNGAQFPYHPNARGFEEFYGFCSGHWGQYFDAWMDHNGEMVPGKGYIVDDITDKAIGFIEESGGTERPFFCYVAYNTPHSPMQVPDRWWEKFRDLELGMRHQDPSKEDVQHTRAALAMCENIDWNVGRLLEAVRSVDAEEDTIVLYFVDNGPNGWRWNGGMKGRKGSTDEGGIRSPLLVRWPGHIPSNRTVDTVAGSIDLAPTLLDLAEVSWSPPKRFDGVSLKGPLFNTGDIAPRWLISHWNGRVTARSQRFRLDHQGHLFDIPVDRGQKVDVASQHPQVHREATAVVTQWREEVLSELERKTDPFTLGHPSARWTQLPARDAVATPGIERSNRFPNSSYFRKWTSTEDRIAWNVTVPRGGRFRVWSLYAANEAAVGARLRLTFGVQSLAIAVDDPHPSPEIGADQDRVRRVEGYEKNWTVEDWGELELDAGSGELVLGADSLPGGESAEIRGLIFERLEP